jgi:DNA-binding MarR family transcriptional regulator
MKNVKSQPDRDRHNRLITELPESIRREIRAATLFAHAVAKSSGIHPTDIRCLDFLSRRGCATAGDLAEVTGLTSGAVTAVINRMEKAGIVRRTTDTKDRRKVIVKLMKGHFNRLRQTRDFFANEIPLLLSGYGEGELRTILDWNIKITGLLQDKAKKLKNMKKQRSQ